MDTPIDIHLTADRVAVVAFVAMQDAGLRHLLKQGRSGRAVGHLTAGEQEGDGPASAVGQRVDLGRAPATGAADGLGPLPPFPPDAERWALTAELSISTCAGGPLAPASAWKSPLHMPLAAQRT